MLGPVQVQCRLPLQVLVLTACAFPLGGGASSEAYDLLLGPVRRRQVQVQRLVQVRLGQVRPEQVRPELQPEVHESQTRIQTQNIPQSDPILLG